MTGSQTKIFVAGHGGMVGSAICRQLEREPGIETVTAPRQVLDLTDPGAVRRFLRSAKPDWVVVAAGKVGGIAANDARRAEFIQQNLAIALNCIHESYAAGVEKLLYLGSSCIYPRDAEQPITEEQLLAGPLESTNQPYAIAKIAGIELCAAYGAQHGVDYRALMPSNLYGPGDNYDPEESHVVAALLQRFHLAVAEDRSEVEVWGSGKPRREFLFVDDLARACVQVMSAKQSRWRELTGPDLSHLNVGTGSDISISELAAAIAATVGFRGLVTFNPERPDGTPRKLLDTHRLSNLGWRPETALELGLRKAYQDYIKRSETLSGHGTSEG